MLSKQIWFAMLTLLRWLICHCWNLFPQISKDAQEEQNCLQCHYCFHLFQCWILCLCGDCFIATLANFWVVVVFNAERIILSGVQVLAPMALKPCPKPVFLVLFRKDLAMMNGKPQPNWKWMPALGIETRSLSPESQPLTIRPFLTP